MDAERRWGERSVDVSWMERFELWPMAGVCSLCGRRVYLNPGWPAAVHVRNRDGTPHGRESCDGAWRRGTDQYPHCVLPGHINGSATNSVEDYQ